MPADVSARSSLRTNSGISKPCDRPERDFDPGSWKVGSSNARTVGPMTIVRGLHGTIMSGASP